MRLLARLGDKLVVFLAWSNDQLVGFRLIGCSKNHVVGLFLATDPAANHLHVGPFLVDRLLAWCFENGYKTFDFMPSGKLEGVITYKASFGATQVPISEVIVQNRVGQALAIARTVTKRVESWSFGWPSKKPAEVEAAPRAFFT